MQKVNIVLVDDIDGSEASETVRFGLDGKAYEIDLNDKNAAKLRKALSPYLSNGRWTAGTRKKKSNVSTSDIRKWANQNGFNLSTRGAIPKEARDAYAAAH